MPAVTPSSGASADNIEIKPPALVADGATTAAEASGVAGSSSGAAVGMAAGIAAGSGLDAVSAAITAAMSSWPAELAACMAEIAALATETGASDSTSAATLESQDQQNAAMIHAAVAGPGGHRV